MSRRRETRRTIENRLEAMNIASDMKSDGTKSNPKDLISLKNLIRNRDSLDAIVTKHIFDKLKASKISKKRIVGILVETGCPLDFVLLMEDAEVTRMMLERKDSFTRNESCLLMELAMRSTYLENLKVLVQGFGAGAALRRDIFSTKMYEMINRPHANLTTAKRFIEQLINADAIDDNTLHFLEKTFEIGKKEAVKVLLDCKMDEHVRKKLGDDLLVHIFGNVNVDVVEVLRGRRFNVHAKCGDMAALHFASLIKSERNVQILLNAGADPNVKDCHGMTPLFAFGNDKCVQLLLHNGADVQAIANNGYTVLDMIFHPSLLEILLAHIALIEAQGTPIKTRIRSRIMSRRAFNEFYDMCCKQIEVMEKLRIHDGFYLYTALVGKPETIAGNVNSHETVDELSRECRKIKIHPYYLATLDKNFNRALSIYNLRCKVSCTLANILEEFQLDDLIIGNVVEFLCFDDLIEMV